MLRRNSILVFFIFITIHLYLLFPTGAFALGEGAKNFKQNGKGETKLTCPEEIVVTEKYGHFHFPETEAKEGGNFVQVKCPFGFRNDGYQPIYGDVSSLESKVASSGANRECVLVKDSSGESRAEWRPYHHDQVEINFCKRDGWNASLIYFNEQIAATTALTFRKLYLPSVALLTYAGDDYECALALINGFAYLLSSPHLSGITRADRNMILVRLNSYLKDVGTKLPPGFKVKVGDAGIAIETAVIYGMQYFARAKNLSELNRYNPYAETISGVRRYSTKISPENETSLVAEIDISAEAMTRAIDQTNMSDPQLKITAYSEEVVKMMKGNDEKPATPLEMCAPVTNKASVTTNNSDVENGTDFLIGNETEIRTWGLLCIEFNGTINNLTDPVEFVIFDDSEDHQLTCVYWDSSEGNWSNDGVTTTRLENGVLCSSIHLSAFSALIEPLPLPFPGAEYAPINNSIHSYILAILSSIGSVCSIIGLSFTLITFGIFRVLRRERSNRILINLCISLLLLHIMSVSGTKTFWDEHCFVPALSLHYLVLTSLAWMMIEAMHMYDLLISVFVRPETRFLLKRIFLAWVMPLIIVVTCAIVQPQVYQRGRADLCLMNAHENIFLYYGSYIGPVCMMLLVNLVIFVRIFRVFYQQTKRDNAAARHGTIPKYYLIKISPSQVKGATSVLVLLGIGWILGLLAMGPFEVLFRYLYCICNAGQGLFIFIFRVALNPQAMKQWKKIIVEFPSDNSLDMSVTTSSTASGKRKFQQKSTGLTPSFISPASSADNTLTASNPISSTLASTLAAALRAENERVASQMNVENE